MKYWTKEHTFDHPWHTVVHAAYRKYPNPESENVVGLDVLRQRIRNGVLFTERIFRTRFGAPGWAVKLTGYSGNQHSIEYTQIDPKNRIMRLMTKNLNLCNLLRFDERLTYTADPHNPERTLLKQEFSVDVSLPAFADYCERSFLSVYQKQAQKGPKALEWVIDELAQDLDGGIRLMDNLMS